MRWKSVADLDTDVAAWATRLPAEVSLVVGVPRSGLLVANLLALHLNLPMTDVAGLCEGRVLAGGRRQAASGRDGREGTVLVVDDSLDTGRSLEAAREQVAAAGLDRPVLWGAAYVTPGAEGLLDVWAETVGKPRVFEWNVMHHPNLSRACMDIDGVLCRDPTDAENDDGDAYTEFLRTAPVRTLPSVRVGKLVTSRLERYRPETERWLEAHGVRYGELHMLDLPTAEERRRLKRHAAFKAEVYASAPHWLFVESDARQAAEIARRAHRPVYCTDTRRMVYPGVADVPGALPRARDERAWARPSARVRVRTQLGRGRRLVKGLLGG